MAEYFVVVPIEELERGDDGYCLPPNGVTVSRNGAGYAKGHRGQIYPPGTFGENTTAFNSETALQAPEIGRERKRQAVRAKFEENYGMPIEEIIGDDTVLLHEEIVRNSDASARSRIDAETFIIDQAGLGEAKGQASSSGASVKIEGLTPELARDIKELVVAIQSKNPPELPE